MSQNATDVVFFDARDTLGEVDRPGHLIPYRPSTAQLLEAVSTQLKLRIGVITNLPADVTAAMGHQMVRDAVLDEKAGGERLTIGDFIKDDDIITNHEASAALGRAVQKPEPEMFRYAAERLGVPVERCLFVGENLLEIMGAKAAGMRSMLKPCPPGCEFAPALVAKLGQTATDSGRQFEAFFEHEHLLGERIFAAGEAIAAALAKLTDGKAPRLEASRWTSPPVVTLPDKLRRAMSYFMHLIDHFADPVHLRAEEAMVEVAIACGMDWHKTRWLVDQHEQARAYWRALDVAWGRIRTGDADDRFYALIDFQRCTQAFVELFQAHAVRENNQLYPEAGSFFDDTDDAMVLNLVSHFGPSDITPYVAMVERMEALLVGGGD